ncbi:hypothetical protein [Brevundimonas sp. Root1279]|uniref:hypothetical protein n=1 Tax=Brevundimonas sp. Root1279 TaxID=1736443 RepID=UPI000ADE7A17|nr:hypothetical protein [Brevundimonas sp. Root1279]
MNLRPLLESHVGLMANQLVDSSLETTRLYWRKKSGATPLEAADPRPFAVVLAERAAA